MDLTFHEEVAQWVVVQNLSDLIRKRGTHALIDVPLLVPQRLRCLKQQLSLLARALKCGFFEELSAVKKIVVELACRLAGFHLLGNGVAPRSHGIGPGIDAEEPAARGSRGKDTMDAILVIRIHCHRDGGGGGGFGVPYRQGCGNGVVALAPYQCGDGDNLADYGFRGYVSRQRRADIVDTKALSHAHRIMQLCQFHRGRLCQLHRRRKISATMGDCEHS